MEVRDKINQLERTILELGTEIFRMKSQLSSLRTDHDNFIEIMGGLKSILDEKGLINEDDFDNAVALGQAISSGHHGSGGVELSFEEELDRLKKNSH